MLKKSIKVGTIEIKNRLVMPPMATEKSTDEGTVTDELCDYYRKRTEGGYIGLVITEHSFVSQEGKASKRQLSISRDSDVEGLKKLVDTIHLTGTKVIAQINHAGSAADREITGEEAVGVSGVRHPRKKSAALPRELTLEEIKELEEKYVLAAVRAKKAGYDGVEIHSAHSYFLNQFYSPLTNRRNDEYGPQSIENRVRAHVEIIRKVRAAVGSDYPIALRLGGCDYMDGGSTIDDAVKACMIFEKEGVDLLDISGGMCGYIIDADYPGYFRDMTIKIKENVSVPVILTGGIVTSDEAEELLEDGYADMIGVGRAIFRDENWAKNNMDR